MGELLPASARELAPGGGVAATTGSAASCAPACFFSIFLPYIFYVKIFLMRFFNLFSYNLPNFFFEKSFLVANFFLKKFSAALHFPLKFFSLSRKFSSTFLFFSLSKNFIEFVFQKMTKKLLKIKKEI